MINSVRHGVSCQEALHPNFDKPRDSVNDNNVSRIFGESSSSDVIAYDERIP